MSAPQLPPGQPPGYPAPYPPGYPAPYPPPYPPPWAAVRPTNTLAVLSLVLGFVAGPAGLVLGIIARRQIARTGEAGGGLAIAGIVLGSVWLVFVVLLVVAWIALVLTLPSGSFGP